MREEPVVCDSVTELGPEHAGRIAVCASHGGIYPAWYAARLGVRALVLNDAGIGKDEAGVAGLLWLDALGIPAAALDHDSCRIGDGADAWACGVVSRVNRAAQALGVRPGQSTAEAVARLAKAAGHAVEVPDLAETRQRIEEACRDGVEVWALDSASLVRPADCGAILAIGSHGGLLGGRPEKALRVCAFAALFNDAGIGKDEAGVTRLPVLAARGIAAATVDCFSARIGEGLSTYRDGILSRVNEIAARLGAQPGMSARAFVALCVEAASGRRAGRRGGG